MAPMSAALLLLYSIKRSPVRQSVMTEKVTELSDPESAVARELSILSAASLLKWKKNAVGPKMLGFKVRIMRSVHPYNSLLLF